MKVWAINVFITTSFSWVVAPQRGERLARKIFCRLQSSFLEVCSIKTREYSTGQSCIREVALTELGGYRKFVLQVLRDLRESILGTHCELRTQSSCWYYLCYRLGGQVTSVRRNPSSTSWQRRRAPLTESMWRLSTRTCQTMTSRVCLRPLEGSSLAP